VDPGEHRFSFDAEGHIHGEQSVLLYEGDKNRLIRVLLTTVAPPQSEPPIAVTVPPAPAVPRARDATTTVAGSSAPVSAYVSLGVGGVGAIVAAVFGALALGNKSALDTACRGAKTDCPPSSKPDIDAMHRNAMVSDVGLIVMGLGGGIGAALLLLDAGHPSHDAGGAQVGRLQIAPWLGAGAAGIRGALP
jgi:hypothetical protein